MRITLSSLDLFLKKALILFGATLALIPLVQYKHLLSAQLYVGGLLVLHLFFFYMYFVKVPWREIARDRTNIIIRLVGIAFLLYLLTVLKLEGSTTVILSRIVAVFFVHVCILLFLLVTRVEFLD